MSFVGDSVRAAEAELELQELLRARPTALLGVSGGAADALDQVGIRTVFDLATSQLFAAARAASRLGDFASASSRFGLTSGDLLRDDVEFESIAEIPGLAPSALRAVPVELADPLATALDVETIRDLALWPPHRAALALIGEAAGGSAHVDDAAEDLRPRFGEFPTERVYYDTVVMLDFQGDDGATELTGPVSLEDTLAGAGGFTRPAVGALLTFTQSWFAQGVTLGHMLHSLALAPGEATRVAVVDWSRRTRATSTEAVSESEALDNAAQHSRALSEVQRAVADDFQAGGSQSSTSSFSQSGSVAAATGTGLLTSLVASGDMSATFQEASTSSAAQSSSWSLGKRSVLGSMTQNVNDRTTQHATSVRNRRASAVREVAQSEHEEVSTRIVANYNHMHALTIQYYEVVQIYRVVAELQRADRLLFVPLQLLDFAGDGAEALVDRFRGPLIRGALTRRIRSLLVDDTTSVAVMPAVPVRTFANRPELFSGVPFFPQKPPFTGAGLAEALSSPESAKGFPSAPGSTSSTLGTSLIEGVRVWDSKAVARVSHLLDRAVLRPDSDALHVPDDAELVAVSFDRIRIRQLRLDAVGVDADIDTELSVPSDSGRVDLARPLRLAELEAIHVSKDAEGSRSGSMTLHCTYLGRRFSLPPVPMELGSGTEPQRVVSFETDQADRRRELLSHLRGNTEYYSRAIFRSLDAATLTLLLASLTWRGRPLVGQVEPKPVMIAGNYLVLRAPVDDDEASGVGDLTWNRLLSDRGLEFGAANGDQRLIAIPTSGVFAEAVLGRSNSAEKLDITRFWNWQDSPIPLAPPEIAPLDTGSRGTTEDLQPGELSAPVLNIVNPTTLPDPAGIGAALTALSNMNFRDMSGLAGTQALAQSAAAGTLKAATDAGQLASTNLQAEAQKSVAMGQIAADLAKSVIGAVTGMPPGGGGGSVQGISGEGARINHGRDMDTRGVPVEAPGDASGGEMPSGGTPAGSGGGGPASSGGTTRTGGAGERRTHEARAVDPTIRATDAVGRLSPPAHTTGGAATTREAGTWRPPAGISSIRLWVNAFIPKDVAGLTIELPGGDTAIPGPIPGVSDAFLTDQRTFSSDPLASSRMHSELEILVDRAMPSIITSHRCGETVEVDAEDGDVEGRDTAETNRMSFHNLRILSSTTLSLQYRSAANNPLVTGSPDIDFDGTILVDLTAMTVTIDGRIDEFPAFEAYVTRDGSAPTTLFQEPPHPGVAPWNLFGPANRPIGRSVPLPPGP
jgi:hypothetical protein